MLDENDERIDIPAGFYATAYEWNSETIISYRGTDKYGRDTVYGYGIGLGFTGVFAPQGDLALEFYSSDRSIPLA